MEERRRGLEDRIFSTSKNWAETSWRSFSNVDKSLDGVAPAKMLLRADITLSRPTRCGVAIATGRGESGSIFLMPLAIGAASHGKDIGCDAGGDGGNATEVGVGAEERPGAR